MSLLTELTGSQGTDHDETGAHTAEEATDTELLGDLDEAASGCLTRESLRLVDLGQESVGGLRDKGGSAPSDDTTEEVEACLGTAGQLLLGLAGSLDEGFRCNFKEVELGHGVRNLLEEDGTEARVEALDTLLTADTSKATEETVGVARLRHETDTGSLERAQGNVGKEFGDTRCSQVHGTTVGGGSFKADLLDDCLLPELVTVERKMERSESLSGNDQHMVKDVPPSSVMQYLPSELERALEEVAGSRGAETSEESAAALLGNDLAESSDHTLHTEKRKENRESQAAVL